MDTIKRYIVNYLEREYALPEGVDIDTFDFLENGYVDSMGMIQFVVLLEDEFGIAFDDEELSLPEFKTVGGLAGIIHSKMEALK
ncbi:MAG: acyl carrier protein [Lachnospiraceae bacterium]|nr:acyl carrier protein [Lachnospiraceae bacterium]